MLPSVEFNLPDVPYRLPTRLQTYSEGTPRFNSEKHSSHSCYQSPVSRAYTSIDYFSRKTENSHIEASKISRITPVISLNPDELNGKSFKFKTKNQQLMNLYNSALSDIESLLTNSHKLLWVDELKQWIIDEPSILEYLELSKKAKLFENQIIRVNTSKMRYQEEVEVFARLSKHSNTARKNEKKEKLKTIIWDSQSPTKPQSNSAHQKRVHTLPATFNNRLLTLSVSSPLPAQLVHSDDQKSSSHKSISPFQSNISIKSNISDKSHISITSGKCDTYTFLLTDSESRLKQLPPDQRPDKLDNTIECEKNAVEEFDPIEKMEVQFPKTDSPIIAQKINNINSVNDNDDYGLTSDNPATKPLTFESTVSNRSNQSIVTSHVNDVNIFDENFKVPEINATQIICVKETTDTVVELLESQNLDSDNQANKEVISKARHYTHTKANHNKANSNGKPRIKVKYVSITEPDREVNEIEEEDSEGIDYDSFEIEPLNKEEINSLPQPEHSRPDDSMKVIDTVEIKREIMAPLLAKKKQRWGKKQSDTSYADQLEKERLAELRKLKLRKKLQIAVEKAKQMKGSEIPEGPRFETYGFLAKYCILKSINVGLYRNTFDVCDEFKKQWLNNDELMMALRGVNPNLKTCDMTHMHMVLKMCDYDMKNGADFKLFSVLAALSVQISTLDSWVKAYIETSEFKVMQMKIRYCRKLWECIVDPATNTVSVNSLCIELKAGGVTEPHINEIRQRLCKMGELNLIDFLTYIPLFIVIHMSIIDNPLNMTAKI